MLKWLYKYNQITNLEIDQKKVGCQIYPNRSQFMITELALLTLTIQSFNRKC